MEVKIAEIGTKLAKDEEIIESHIEDFKDFQKDVKEHLAKLDSEIVILHRLTVSIEQLANNVTSTNDKIDKLAAKQEEMGTQISNLEHAPAKKTFAFAEGLKNDIIKLIIVGAVCFLLGGILPFPIG